MAPKGVLLSHKEYAEFKLLLERVKKLPLNLPLQYPVPLHLPSPDVYIAKVPSGGIDPISGTTPGSADCDIYHIDVVTDPATPTLTQVDGVTKTVYNITLKPIAENIYITIQKDKSGAWLPSGAGSGGAIIMKGVLTKDLLVSDADASVDSIVSLTPGATAPSGTAVINADNLLNWAGTNGDVCILLQDPTVSATGTGDTEWKLLAVIWDTVTPVTNVYDEGGNTGTGTVGNNVEQTKQGVIGKTVGASSDSTVFQTSENCP